MATFDTNFPIMAFPHEVDEVVISATEATDVRISFNAKEILNTKLYPFDGKIELRGIADLYRDLMDDKVGQLRFELGGQPGPLIMILSCTLNLSHTFEEVSNGFFCTRATFKYTHADATEWLHVISEANKITVKGLIRPKGGDWLVQKKDLTFTDSSTPHHIDVSPRTLYDLDHYELAEYTVEAGLASVKYRIIPDGQADTLHEFGFINSFQQVEYITLMGEAEREMKTERLHAMVGGQYRNYKIEGVPYWKINSGVLPDGMLGLFDDFITSNKIWRKSDNCAMAITNADFKTSSSNDALNRGSVTLRETGRKYRHNVPKAVNTFDITFDDTFL